MLGSRAESIIRRLTRPARRTAWILGVFDSNGDLLEFAMRGFQLDSWHALEMLCAAPLPESPGGVTLRVTGDDGNPAPTLRASILLDTERSLVFIVVRTTATDKAWSTVAQGLQPAVRRIATLMGSAATPVPEPSRPAAPSRSDGSGFVLLNSELTILWQWYPHDLASVPLAKLIDPYKGRLPLLFERTVRRLTHTWDFARIETCLAATAYPLPGLALRVAPICGAGVLIGVFLEPHSEHPVDRAASAFRISPRERDVLHALFDGYGVAEIAALLNIAESTVNDHVTRMIAKTNAHNRVEMVATLLGWPAVKASLRSGQRNRGPAKALCDGAATWLEATKRARRNDFLP